MKNKFLFQIKNSQKGVILFLAIVIMAILLSIGLGISTILMSQIAITRSIGNSVIAFYAADTGIERVLLNRNVPSPPGISPPESLGNNATYEVEVYSASACDSSNTDGTVCFHSVGTFQGVRRAIEVIY